MPMRGPVSEDLGNSEPYATTRPQSLVRLLDDYAQTGHDAYFLHGATSYYDLFRQRPLPPSLYLNVLAAIAAASNPIIEP